jgi:tryptophan synthase alpha chain
MKARDPIGQAFLHRRQRGEKVLIPFLTAGFPDERICRELCLELAQRGADILELGVPFSDPIADGPTIQFSSQVALRSGISLAKILQLVRQIRKDCPVPLVLMSYYNPIFRWGSSRFPADAREAGVDGLIVPDLPPEEAEDLLEACREAALDPIFLVAPTSSERRIRLISKVSEGYIYYVSVTGTTGARSSIPADLKEGVLRLRQMTRTPIAVGFGISTPRQAKEVAAVADGVILGSVLIARIQSRFGRPDLVPDLGGFIARFRRTLDGRFSAGAAAGEDKED